MPQTSQLKFFHNNMLQSTAGSLVATSTATGDFAIDNIHNMLEVNRWKASSSATQNLDFDAGVGNTFDADYIAILGHNLATSGSSVAVIHSTDGVFGGEEVTIFSTAVTADTVYLNQFSPPGGRRWWRVQINGASTAVFIDVLSLGTASTIDFIQPPFDPYNEMRQSNINITQGGFVSGIHDRFTEREFSLFFGNASSSVYSAVSGWWQNSGSKNFFMAWDSTGDATAVYFVRPDMSFNNPYNVNKFRDISINLRGRKE